MLKGKGLRSLLAQGAKLALNGALLGGAAYATRAALAASPIGHSLRVSAGVIVVANSVGFAITALTKSHKITDLTGTTAFIGSAWATHAVACRAAGLGLLAPSKSLLLTGAVTAWGARLASYLFYRVLQTGSDPRLNFLFSKPGEPLLTGPSRYPMKLAGFWTAQGMWAWVCLLPITVAQALAPAAPLGPLAWLGVAGFVVGFGMETIADYQKFVFKNEPANKDRFISTGLYKYCRYPNYSGEILVWTGLTVIAGTGGVLLKQPWVVLSPTFITALLLFVSGVPPLEASHEKRYGKDPAYRQYKESTSLIVPWFKLKPAPPSKAQ